MFSSLVDQSITFYLHRDHCCKMNRPAKITDFDKREQWITQNYVLPVSIDGYFDQDSLFEIFQHNLHELSTHDTYELYCNLYKNEVLITLREWIYCKADRALWKHLNNYHFYNFDRANRDYSLLENRRRWDEKMNVANELINILTITSTAIVTIPEHFTDYGKWLRRSRIFKGKKNTWTPWTIDQEYELINDTFIYSQEDIVCFRTRRAIEYKKAIKAYNHVISELHHLNKLIAFKEASKHTLCEDTQNIITNYLDGLFY